MFLIASQSLFISHVLIGQAPAANGADRNSDPIASTSAEDLRRLFLEKYPSAATRLKAGLSRFHATGRYREYRDKEQPSGDWTTIEIFVDDGKLRIDRQYGHRHASSASPHRKPPDALLLTPDTAATVIDPRTDLAWAKYLSKEPDKRFQTQLHLTAWRFLLASYCTDDASISERIANGRFTLESVQRDPTNNGWLNVTCQFIEPADDPKWTAHGTVDLWFDEAHGYVARRMKLVSLEPYMYELVKEIGPFVSLGDGGYLPESVSISSFDLRQPQPPAAPRNPTLRVEFALSGHPDAAPIAESCFTLGALGIHQSRDRSKLSLWLLLGASAATVAGILATKRSVGRTVVLRGNAASQQLEASR